MFGGVGVSKVYYNDLWSYQISTNKYPRLAFSFSSSSRLLLKLSSRHLLTISFLLRWTLLQGQLDKPLIGGAEPKPVARAFHQVAAFSFDTIIVFGGESSSSGALSDWWTVNINLTCPYLYPPFHHHPQRLYHCQFVRLSVAFCSTAAVPTPLMVPSEALAWSMSNATSSRFVVMILIFRIPDFLFCF